MKLLSSYTKILSSDSFIVTLVCEDGEYNQAHKVVLARSSAQPHAHPLINLRGLENEVLFQGGGIG